ncbi:cyanate permease [Shewanella psychrophila]|uniref:Cyanate permease n=1 Tax=Shewanella psychrophila TaxID=225848 RepID=A0A1S6HK62_9GAMM|nr:MFS transporter [Shewanella psychrophila]AQS35902.1 cyanate permease [Shewanella psychrophila]
MTKNHQILATKSIFLILGILLIAANLRGPITSVAPLLDSIRSSLNLTATQAGLLTTLPLLAFAFMSPLSSKIGHRIGLERALMVALVLILVGIMVRALGSISALILGTFVIGAGIAIANVLLPSLLKRDFPTKVATLTAVYVLTMGIGSAVSSAVAVPMSNLAGHLNISFMPDWNFALVSVILFPLVAILCWLPQMASRTDPAKNTAELDSHSYVWRSPLAWQLTFFLGLNSFVTYIIIGWLPSMLMDAGYSEIEAGFNAGLLQLATALPAIALIPIMGKLKDQSLLAFGTALIALSGILGLLLLPQFATVWVLVFGFGGGAGFIVGLSCISHRTHHTHQAAALSGMAQCVGYLLAATGPILIGSVHDTTGSWNLPLILCAISCGLCSVFGLLAGRDRILENKQSGAIVLSDAERA